MVAIPGTLCLDRVSVPAGVRRADHGEAFGEIGQPVLDRVPNRGGDGENTDARPILPL